MEEVLLAALQNSRRTLHSLEASEKALAESIGREKKQFERLHFWRVLNPGPSFCSCLNMCSQPLAFAQPRR